MICLHHIDGKGCQCRRYMDVLERPRHGILSSDGGDAEPVLCHESAQKRCKGLSPLCLILAKPLEVFLKGQPYIVRPCPQSRHLRHGFHHCVDSAVERAPTAEIRIQAEGHGGCRIRFPILHGELCHHALRGRQLIPASEGHQDSIPANRGIEPLRQSLLAAHIEILEILQPCLFEIAPACPDLCRHLTQIAARLIRHRDARRYMLAHTIRIEKRSVHLHDRLSAPLHHQPRLFRHDRDLRCLQILLVRQLDKRIQILCIDHNCHAFLGFGNRKLRSVQPFIFLFDRIQIDHKPISKLPDRHSHAARAEVIAALDHAACGGIAEKALYLSLRRGIALLHLCAAARKGLLRMFLG